MDPEIDAKIALIAPERRALVARRIKVLERFAALERPTVTDAEDAAADLGLAKTSFYRLFAVWTAYRDPAAIGAGGRPRASSGRRHHPGDPFVLRTFADLPEGRSLNRDVAAIQAAAAEQDVAIRSKTSLIAMVRSLRGHAAHDAPAIDVDAFIDHVVLAIPVAGPTGPTMPVCSVLGDLRTGSIVTLLLRLDPPDPDAVGALLERAATAGALSTRTSREPFKLAMEIGFGSAWTALDQTLARHAVRRIGEEHRRLPGGRTGGPLVYPRLLDIRTHPKTILRPPEERKPLVRERLDEVLELEQAQAAMDARLAASNPGGPLAIAADVDALVTSLNRTS